MVYASRIDVCSWMSNVAVPSRAGDLVVLEEVSEVVDTQKLCQSDPQESEEVLLHLPDLEASVAVGSVAGFKVDLVVAGSEVDSEVGIGPTSAEDEAVSDIKVEVALVEEVAAARRMGTVMVRHRPLTLLLDLEDEVASVVGMVALL